MKRFALLGILFVALAVAAHGQRENQPPPPQQRHVAPRKSPPLVLRNLDGRAVRLSDYRGKVVLLNFWATWCPPCRAEMPELVKLHREHSARGLQIIGVTLPPFTRRTVRDLRRRFKINYPILLGARTTRRLFDDEEVLPTTFVIDRDGHVREIIQGILLPEEFEEKIEPLLQP